MLVGADLLKCLVLYSESNFNALHWGCKNLSLQPHLNKCIALCAEGKTSAPVFILQVVVQRGLTQAQPLVGRAQRFHELAGSELLLDLAPDSGFLGVALLRDADEQHVVLRGPQLPLFEPLLADGASGREVALHAPPAERMAARDGHRLAKQEETVWTLRDVHHVRGDLV